MGREEKKRRKGGRGYEEEREREERERMKGGRGMREEGGNYWGEEERTEEEGKGGRKDWRGKQKVRNGGEKKRNGERDIGKMEGGKQIIPPR